MQGLAAQQLLDTQAAFDSVAGVYDGPIGNNNLIQRMRQQLWQGIEEHVSGGRLLDLGCGTGLDLEHFAGLGYFVTGVDWSAQMVERAGARMRAAGLEARVEVQQRGIHQLDGLTGPAYDGVYSNLGVLNCAPDVGGVARSMASLLKPNGVAVLSVMGRWCPWEVAVFLLRGDWRRATFRMRGSWQAAPLNGRQVWTRYYTPSEFAGCFEEKDFSILTLRTMGLVYPPPYMQAWVDRHSRLADRLDQLEKHCAGWPLVRNAGDHFLLLLRRR